MKAFFGGQIEENKRGELAAIVTRELRLRGVGDCLSVFLYPIHSEEFVHLTGVGDAGNFVERIYIGVSPNAGDEIARQLNGAHIGIDLERIDRTVVVPHFLDKYRDKPKQIILQSTRTGYEVVQPK